MYLSLLVLILYFVDGKNPRAVTCPNFWFIQRAQRLPLHSGNWILRGVADYIVRRCNFLHTTRLVRVERVLLHFLSGAGSRLMDRRVKGWVKHLLRNRDNSVHGYWEKPMNLHSFSHTFHGLVIMFWNVADINLITQVSTHMELLEKHKIAKNEISTINVVWRHLGFGLIFPIYL